MKRLLLAGMLLILFPPICFSSSGMVVSEQVLASQVGASILRSGGNAIDAAVAVGYALAVVNPCCGNIGGGGFMTIHLANGKNTFLNFRETAPLAATANMFLDKNGKPFLNKSTLGYLAVATPGTVMGFETALKKYGTMKRQQVIAPAIKLAKQGFILTAGDIQLLNENLKNFKKQENVSTVFLHHGKPYQIGDRLIQKNLANTLEKISQHGVRAFYEGEIAKQIVKASTVHHGILSMKDFAHYRTEELAPIYCRYRGYSIISAPPPSSGGVTLCEMLNILEKYPLKKLGYQSVAGIHYIVEAMRIAFADRNNQLGDPNFVTNPVDKLISKKYAEQVRKKILNSHASKSEQAIATHEGLNTTHYSVIDKAGNAVSVTYTLNSFFGAQVIAGNTGFFLNNEMDDFAIKPGAKNQFGLVQGVKNTIQPGKRPLSSMTPTIITKDNRVMMIVGSPGGPRIITTTLLIILNVLDYGMTIQEAVNVPRYHHQWLPDLIDIEPAALPAKTAIQLIKMGYRFTQRKPWGAAESIYINPVSKIIYGANDKRRPAGGAVSANFLHH